MMTRTRTMIMWMTMKMMINTSRNHTKGSTREDVSIVSLSRLKPDCDWY